VAPLSASAEDKTLKRLGWGEVWKTRHLVDASTLVLLGVNLIPLGGVLFGG